jgi:hypothetical protein
MSISASERANNFYNCPLQCPHAVSKLPPKVRENMEQKEWKFQRKSSQKPQHAGVGHCNKMYLLGLSE